MSEKNDDTVSDSQSVGNEEKNVDKIREILFGGQMRDYQRRFDELENTLNGVTERLRQDLGKRVESLESFVRRELELLSEKIVAERRERGEQVEQTANKLSETRRKLEDTVASLDEQTAQEARSIRAALQQHNVDLSELIQHARDDFNAVVSRHANALEDRKVGREDLAAMLSELAMRLNRELDLPSE